MNKDDYALKVAICGELYKQCMKPATDFKFEDPFMPIWAILVEINKLEEVIPFIGDQTEKRQNDRDETKFVELVKFLEDQKCVGLKNVSIEKLDAESGFGLKAKSEAKKSDLLFEVPQQAILSSQEAFESELNDLISHDRLLFTMQNVSLALYMLYLKLNSKDGNEHEDPAVAKWKPYLDILPSEFHTPLYFTLDELTALKSSQSFEPILLHIRNVARQYCYMVKVLESDKTSKKYESLKRNFSFRNYKWAVSVVSTRQNQIVDKSKRPLLAMIPLLDMCNHEQGELSTDFDDESGSARCFASRDLKPGDEIRIYYGERNNANLFIHNGFVPAENTNPNNSFAFRLGISLSDKLFHERSEALGKFGINATESVEVKANADGKIVEIPARIFVFVKIFLMKTAEEIQKIIALSDKKTDSTEVYCKEQDLMSSPQIKMFLQTRLTILIRSIEKSITSNNDEIVKQQKEANEEPVNLIFAQRLIKSELKLIKATLDFLMEQKTITS